MLRSMIRHHFKKLIKIKDKLTTTWTSYRE